MQRVLAILLSVLVLAGCEPTTVALGPDGKPLPTVYRIRANDKSKIQYRMLDSVNTLRAAAGAPALKLNSNLNAAAATHSRDMSVQNRPWHFGSDGSSPLDRVRRTGYSDVFMGENISETYETELETLAAWMDEQGTRTVIMDPKARDLGFAYFQEPGGKIWWTMITGGPGVQPDAGATTGF